MYRRSVALPLVAAAWAALLMVSPATAQRSRRPEPQPPEAADAPPARERPNVGPQAGEMDARGRDTREGSEDGWPGGMQERSSAPGQARVFPGFTWPPKWWLGVFVYNTPAGVVITRVVPNSPAARAGLEPRDCIVTVEGYQVGDVRRRLYALGPELQQRAHPNGEVLLLVQNWRNGELGNMEVQLMPSRNRSLDRPPPRLQGERAPQ
jgi:hypothetical protein